MRVRRSAKAEYEAAWSQVATRVQVEIDRGNLDVLGILDRLDESEPQFFASPPFVDHFRHAGVAVGDDGTPVDRVIVDAGRYHRIPFQSHARDFVTPTLLEYLHRHPSVDSVVELGSGYARNLFRLQRRAADELDHVLRWHACEYTQAGRDAARALHRLASGMDLKVHAFDYHHPDLSFLDGSCDVLFFTVCSIEQVPEIGREVIEEMLARSGRCACFHFEPIGWQLDPELSVGPASQRTLLQRVVGSLRIRCRRAVQRTESALDVRLRRGFPGIRLDPSDIGSADRVARNGAAWAKQFDYNMNLVPLLKSLESESRITIERIEADMHGLNPFNPSTLVEWHGAI